jgi:hypothetical protein
VGAALALAAPVARLHLSPGGTLLALATGGTSPTVQAWRLADGSGGGEGGVAASPPVLLASWPAPDPPPTFLLAVDGTPPSSGVVLVGSPGGGLVALSPAGAPATALPLPAPPTCAAADADGDALFVGTAACGAPVCLESPPGRGPAAAARAPPLPPSPLAEVASLTLVGPADSGLLVAVDTSGGVAVWCLAARALAAAATASTPPPPFVLASVAWAARASDDATSITLVGVARERAPGGGLLPPRAVAGAVGPAGLALAPLAPTLAASSLAAAGGLLAARGGAALTVWCASDGLVAARAVPGGDPGAGVAAAALADGRTVRAVTATAGGVTAVDVGGAAGG